ncbi:MAG: TetR/AcrR family transcriptional regulator C-terminal ligand-binding domain-containing protein [Pseudomonadota bacterium]
MLNKTRHGIERRERVRIVVDRAADRGELPRDVDYELANDSLAGILYWGSL